MFSAMFGAVEDELWFGNKRHRQRNKVRAAGVVRAVQDSCSYRHTLTALGLPTG